MVLRAMWRLLMFALLAACSRGPESDLQYIGQARSLAAEWALINEQAAQGTLTETYVSSMHGWLRQQLQTSTNSLTEPDTPYGAEMQALLRLPDDAPPAELRARSEKLRQIEDSLESA
jgi:hypothetical protein